MGTDQDEKDFRGCRRHSPRTTMIHPAMLSTATNAADMACGSTGLRLVLAPGHQLSGAPEFVKTVEDVFDSGEAGQASVVAPTLCGIHARPAWGKRAVAA